MVHHELSRIDSTSDAIHILAEVLTDGHVFSLLVRHFLLLLFLLRLLLFVVLIAGNRVDLILFFLFVVGCLLFLLLGTLRDV